MGRRESHELQLEWDTQTKSWPREDVTSIGGIDFNLGMLAEDLGSQLWAQFHALAEEEERSGEHLASVDCCSPELAAILKDCIPHRNGYRDTLSRCLGEFTRLVASELVHSGEIEYEVCFGRVAGQPSSSPRGALLRYVPHKSLVRVGREFFQVVPERREFGQRETVVSVAGDRIIGFLPPISRRTALSRARAALRAIDQARQNWMQEPATGQGGNFRDVHRRYNIAVARATRDLGWNGRGLWNELSADYHYVSRHLRWKRFGIEVRDRILANIAECFRRIGKTFGENPKLIVRNLPTIQDVEEAEAKLRTDKTRFDVLLNRVS